ncbi:MAG: type II secretion system F family protein [Vampirovibrionales bacterium]|nr:type II secretion system F family protein [Vampirovibrionales bacterium]
MAVFVFEAIDPSNSKTIESKLEAPTLREAKEALRLQGLIPTKIEQDSQSATVEDALQKIPVLGSLLTPGVGLKEINIMTEQLYTLLNAGIPLIEAIFLLEQQTENKTFKQVLRKVRTDVIAGDAFSSSLARYPKSFSRLYVSMIRSGEVSGELDLICKRLSMLLEKMIKLQGQIQGALVYPAFTVLVVIAVVVVIMTFVVPQFKNVFANFGGELPLPTTLLISTSDFFVAYWWAISIIVISAVVWFNYFRTNSGKPLVDQWVLTFPLIGNLLKKVYVSRFIRTLATVIGSGVSLTEALITSAGTCDNYVLRLAFDKAKESLLQGGSLSKPLEQTQAFPIMVVKMIAIGEETGQLESMLNKAADFLDEEVDRAVDALTTMIEPIMIIVLGGIILGVALALYVPMFQMGDLMSG